MVILYQEICHVRMQTTKGLSVMLRLSGKFAIVCKIWGILFLSKQMIGLKMNSNLWKSVSLIILLQKLLTVRLKNFLINYGWMYVHLVKSSLT